MIEQAITYAVIGIVVACMTAYFLRDRDESELDTVTLITGIALVLWPVFVGVVLVMFVSRLIVEGARL